VIVSDGRVANVFVRVKSGQKAWIYPETASGTVHLDQEGCVYTPHVLAIQRGQRLLVSNGDELTHNVNVRAKRNPSSNVTQAAGSPPLELSLDRAETSIQVKCDIHPWMGAVVHVSDTPWFGVSDAAGELVIEAVPPGSWVLEAVHEDLGRQRVEVVVEPSATATASFTFED
jgi:plastocyanin